MDRIKSVLSSKPFKDFAVGFIILMCSNFIFLMIWWRNEISSTAIKDKTISDNFASIISMRKDIKAYTSVINNLTVEDNKIENLYHEVDLKILSLKSNIKNVSDYQQTLRKEVKANAENKVSDNYFWHIINPISIRVRWLEEHNES